MTLSASAGGTCGDEERYRNTHAYIYSGEQIVVLDCTIDDYGAVPPDFPITETEFAIGWWSHTKAVQHNNNFFLGNDILSKLNFTKNDEGYYYAPVNLRVLVGNKIESREFWAIIDQKTIPISPNFFRLIAEGRYREIFCELLPFLVSDSTFDYISSSRKSWMAEAESHPLIFLRNLEENSTGGDGEPDYSDRDD